MTASELSDLIGRVSLGDRQAFRQLYDRTNAKLFGVCLRILRDRASAEDCLQDVFVKIWLNASKYTVSGYSPVTWLCAIARNDAIDRIRARKPQAADIDEALDIASQEPDPEKTEISRSEMGRIETCLGKLGVKQAEAVRGAYLDGYSYQDLSERYKMPLNTVRTWLRRSLISLRECLQQ
jgi:RNA polymerase sigma-70 factor (ECF subfamily)